MCIYISIIELTTQHINFVFKSQIESQILCLIFQRRWRESDGRTEV